MAIYLFGTNIAIWVKLILRILICYNAYIIGGRTIQGTAEESQTDEKEASVSLLVITLNKIIYIYIYFQIKENYIY